MELSRARVRVRVVGEGHRTIVFLPDPPNVIEHYDPLFDLLSDSARVVCVEAPGFGFSLPARGFTFSLDEQAETMVELLETLAAGPYVLSFLCAGTYIALKVAATRPDFVEGLVIGQAPSWSQELEWARRLDPGRVVRTPYLGQLVLALGKRGISRRWYRAALPHERVERLAHAFDEPAFEAFGQGASFCLASTFQALFAQRSQVFEEARNQAVVVWGADDPTHRRTEKRSVLEYVPHARWEEFADAGHFPDLEEPERYANILREMV